MKIHLGYKIAHQLLRSLLIISGLMQIALAVSVAFPTFTVKMILFLCGAVVGYTTTITDLFAVGLYIQIVYTFGWQLNSTIGWGVAAILYPIPTSVVATKLYAQARQTLRSTNNVAENDEQKKDDQENDNADDKPKDSKT